MHHLSVSDIRISYLFKGNAIFCLGTMNLFLWAALTSSVSTSFESRLPFDPYNVQNPLENCCVQQVVGPPFFEIHQIISVVEELH